MCSRSRESMKFISPWCFDEDSKEMYQKVRRTSAERLFLLVELIALWCSFYHPRPVAKVRY